MVTTSKKYEKPVCFYGTDAEWDARVKYIQQNYTFTGDKRLIKDIEEVRNE